MNDGRLRAAERFPGAPTGASRRSLRGLSGAVMAQALFSLTLVTFGALGFLSAPRIDAPREREIVVSAFQYGYQPEVIKVNRGDTVRLRFMSKDVVHGFYLEGYDLDVTIIPLRAVAELRRPSEPGNRELVEEVVFAADREGKFRYRCSSTCGFLHPFMLGELIVQPNRLLPTGLALALGVLIGGFLVTLLGRERA